MAFVVEALEPGGVPGDGFAGQPVFEFGSGEGAWHSTGSAAGGGEVVKQCPGGAGHVEFLGPDSVGDGLVDGAAVADSDLEAGESDFASVCVGGDEEHVVGYAAAVCGGAVDDDGSGAEFGEDLPGVGEDDFSRVAGEVRGVDFGGEASDAAVFDGSRERGAAGGIVEEDGTLPADITARGTF